jgi:uncharacterized membrane-anchored protein
MNARTRGLVVAALQIAIVCSLALKYTVDRQVRPRVWARAVGYDPQALIRGRYVQLGVVVEATGRNLYQPMRVVAENGRLKAVPDPHGSVRILPVDRNQPAVVGPIAYFLPEGVPDPTRRKPGEELWAEVTVPRQGPPRPIRLAVKREGKLEELPY